MGVRHYHLMRKPGEEEVKKVALNMWAHHRRQGYEFLTAEEELVVNQELLAKQDIVSTSKEEPEAKLDPDSEAELDPKTTGLSKKKAGKTGTRKKA